VSVSSPVVFVLNAEDSRFVALVSVAVFSVSLPLCLVVSLSLCHSRTLHRYSLLDRKNMATMPPYTLAHTRGRVDKSPGPRHGLARTLSASAVHTTCEQNVAVMTSPSLVVRGSVAQWLVGRPSTGVSATSRPTTSTRLTGDVDTNPAAHTKTQLDCGRRETPLPIPLWTRQSHNTTA
jgi:hypothetical protein